MFLIRGLDMANVVECGELGLYTLANSQITLMNDLTPETLREWAKEYRDEADYDLETGDGKYAPTLSTTADILDGIARAQDYSMDLQFHFDKGWTIDNALPYHPSLPAALIALGQQQNKEDK